MSGKWKVRFHLGKGQHFRHFQVTSPEGERTFYDPENYYLTMENARLYNNCKVAEQIYNGRNKTVCSWIACDSVQVESIMSYLFSPKNIDLNPSNVELKYNPRVNPHWLENGKNVDSKSYPRLFTIDERVFVGGRWYRMTVPLPQETLYGSTYNCRRLCSKCKSSNWYDLKDTEHLLCLDCGHQEPM